MIIVVDAYNVVKQIVNKKEISEPERAAFLNQMHKYARQREHQMILVFDGGPNQWPEQEHDGNLSIVYSGYQETADNYIKHYLTQHKSKDLMLVSSDRELRDMADRLGVAWIDSVSFYRIVQQRIKEQLSTEKRSESMAGPIVKTTATQEPGLDELMQKATEHIEYKTEDETLVRHSKEKVAKKKRMRMRKIDKL